MGKSTEGVKKYRMNRDVGVTIFLTRLPAGDYYYNYKLTYEIR